jgi:hypothetical protein
MNRRSSIVLAIAALLSLVPFLRSEQAPVFAHTAPTALDPCQGAPVTPVSLSSKASKPPKLEIDADDIGGKVASAAGVDVAGVWVIAEADLITVPMPTPDKRGRDPRKFRKIVVTDDSGRFVVPDVPSATYKLWVRGYGLRDSDPVTAVPGEHVTLIAAPARCGAEAAKVYPANYWFSLFEVPPADQFPGTGPTSNGGNGISESMRFQDQWVMQMKLGCQLCHQLGNHETRLHDHIAGVYDSGHHVSGAAAFDRHVQSGQRGSQMSGSMSAFGREAGLATHGKWAETMASGGVPEAPPRPKGRERNIVLTMWEWADEVTYAHDEIVTDKRNPTVNANGPVWGVDFGNDRIQYVDPVNHTAAMLKIPNPRGVTSTYFPQNMSAGFPSAKWGTEIIWTNHQHPHNPMMDADGKVWITVQIREASDVPDFCLTTNTTTTGLPDPSAPVPPSMALNNHQLGYYDPARREFVLIDTCYSTHHLQFDKKGVLWLSGDLTVVGWFDPSRFDPNDPNSVARAQGWSTVIVDSNGDGVPDTPLVGFHYGIVPNPADGSIWTGVLPVTSVGDGGEPAASAFPGRIERYDPLTGRHEAYEPPSVADPNLPPGTVTGHGPRGIDVDKNGLIWTALGGSGHLASFDRSKCRQAWGTGQQCPEGWTLHATPGPQMKNVSSPGSADFHYYNWVDQWNTFGMGEDVPIATGSGSDSLLLLDPATKEWLVARVPYPLGFYSRGLDGRIDDPTTGWKGRGLWATFGTVAAWHVEGEMGNMVKFQLRPHPLAH